MCVYFFDSGPVTSAAMGDCLQTCTVGSTAWRGHVTFGSLTTSVWLSMSVVVLRAGSMSLVPVRITFSMLAKCAISAVFAIVFLYTPEIFPTTLRSR